MSGSPSVVANKGVATVPTRTGVVAGFIRNGIFTFKGIPYAASTAGDNRFMPPLPATPWEGVRSSRQFGCVAPQAARGGWADDEDAFLFSWDDGVQGEDCLRVNIWTPGIDDGKKRPVMVWLHGGGFAAGSGQELKSYDGENLARRGDVVVVTLNHRLNVLGHLDLSHFGEAYASSPNVGLLDIVAALAWVRDNIAGFGGDPATVTLFGQSGGGWKISLLMGMPAARGLFHRAIVESGSMLRAGTQEHSRQLGQRVVAELGLTRATIGRIQTLPYQILLQAGDKVLREHHPMPGMPGFGPVVDGQTLPAHPFDPVASALSADVPMIIGTTLNEFVTALSHPEYEAMTEDELTQHVTGLYGERAHRIIAAFRRATPKVSPFDLWSRISAATMRKAAIEQARIKAAAGAAPAYLYWFTWQSPILDGRARAFHCSEIAFVFDNTDRCENMTGGGADARALGAVMSDAWVQFARTGNPDHPGMPHWPAFTAERVPTMVFDNRTQRLDNPDGDEQQSMVVT